MIRFLSGSIPGKKFGLDPVAIIEFFASIISSEPSAFLTEILVLETNEPVP